MRICLYTHTALPLVGGQEMVVDALARQFTRLGHHPVVLAPRPSRVARLDDEELPYPVVRHPRFISKHLVGWYRWWLLRLQQRYAFDVVHGHGLFPVGYLAARCRDRLGCPLVLTSHGEDVGPAGRHRASPRVHAWHRQAAEAADALIAISRYTRDGYAALAPQTADRIVALPNGVDLADYAAPVPRPADLDPSIRSGGYVLFLGRLEPRKGVDVLLDALARLPGDGRTQLVVAGDGRQRGALAAQTARLGLGGRVRFVGLVRGAAKTYLVQNARCLVLPSVGWEGQPVVVLEAFAAGRPVLVSDLPGFADLVRHDDNGWVVPQRDDAALAAALGRALTDDTAMARLAARAAASALDHSWEAIARRHLELYAAVSARRRSGRAA